MAKGQSLQDPFLNALRRERVPVSIYLVNGIKLQGQVESFDQFVILLKNTVSQWYTSTLFLRLFLLAHSMSLVTKMPRVDMVRKTMYLVANKRYLRSLLLV